MSLLTPNKIREELVEYPERYPTKDDWIEYMSVLAHNILTNFMLDTISKGTTIINFDEKFENSYKSIMKIGDDIWKKEKE